MVFVHRKVVRESENHSGNQRKDPNVNLYIDILRKKERKKCQKRIREHKCTDKSPRLSSYSRVFIFSIFF